MEIRIRLRSQLLEFLKFRVLAAQHSFFDPFETSGKLVAAPFRQWLATSWPDALALDDQDLLEVLQQARMLYVN
jgi:hypothetical protein